MAMVTMIDLLNLQQGVGFELINETLVNFPELATIPTQGLNGNSMRLTVRTERGTANFRNYNEGTAYTKGEWETRVFEAMPITKRVGVDQEEADQFTPEGKARLFAEEVSESLESAASLIGTQTWYGNTAQAVADAKGFPGVIDQMNTGTDYNTTAGGTTALSSVYFTQIAPNKLYLLLANGKPIGMEPSWRLDTILDSSSNPYDAYVNKISGGIGLRVANRKCIGRIHNIDASANPLTWALLRTAMNKYLAQNGGMRPTHIWLAPRSVEQLWNALVTTETVNPDRPTSFMGVPFVETGSISIAETV